MSDKLNNLDKAAADAPQPPPAAPPKPAGPKRVVALRWQGTYNRNAPMDMAGVGTERFNKDGLLDLKEWLRKARIEKVTESAGGTDVEVVGRFGKSTHLICTPLHFEAGTKVPDRDALVDMAVCRWIAKIDGVEVVEE